MIHRPEASTCACIMHNQWGETRDNLSGQSRLCLPHFVRSSEEARRQCGKVLRAANALETNGFPRVATSSHERTIRLRALGSGSKANVSITAGIVRAHARARSAM